MPTFTPPKPDEIEEAPQGFIPPAPDEIEETPTATATPEVSQTEGLVAAGKRGLLMGQMIPEAAMLAGTEGTDRPTIRQRRRAFVQAMEDPRYGEAQIAAGKMDASGLYESDPAKLRQIERSLGPEGKLDVMMTPQRALQQAQAGTVAELQGRIQALPKSEAQARMASAATTSDKWAAWRKDPIELTASIVLESLPPSLAGGMVGAAGGPGGVAVGAGAASAAATFSGELLGYGSQRYDLTDPDQVLAWINGKEFSDDVQRAAVKGGIVGQVDASTAGMAGKFIEPALKQGLKSILIAGSKELGIQAAGGSGGEAAGQIASGQPLDPFDIAMEGVAEVFTAPTEAYGNVRAGQKLAQAEALKEKPKTTKLIPKKGKPFTPPKPTDIEPSASQPAAPASVPTSPPAADAEGTPAAPPAALYEHGLQSSIDELTNPQPLPVEEPAKPAEKPLATVGDAIGAKLDELNGLVAQMKAEGTEAAPAETINPKGETLSPATETKSAGNETETKPEAASTVTPETSDAEAFIKQISATDEGRSKAEPEILPASEPGTKAAGELPPAVKPATTKRLFHGTPVDWEAPKLGRPGLFWLTEDEEKARTGYARGGPVKAFDADLGNVADLTDPELYEEARRIYNNDSEIKGDEEREQPEGSIDHATVLNSADVVTWLQDSGFNSVRVYEDAEAKEASYAIFDTKQLTAAKQSNSERQDSTTVEQTSREEIEKASAVDSFIEKISPRQEAEAAAPFPLSGTKEETHDPDYAKLVPKAKALANERMTPDKVRADGSTKISHVERVADLARDEGPLYEILAYLHDLPEDTDTTIDEIRETFGDRVADAVIAETWDKDTESYEAYIERLIKNPDAVRGKLMDLADNFNMPPGWEKIPKLVAKRADYIKAIARINEALSGPTPDLTPTLERPTMPDGTPREVWRKEQILKVAATATEIPEGYEREVVFMAGGPAAGKSTIADKARFDGTLSPHYALTISADDFKMGAADPKPNSVTKAGAQGIPEVAALLAAGDPRAAAVGHRESSIMAKGTLARVLTDGKATVYDATMDDHATDMSLIKGAIKEKYKVKMIGVAIHPQEALRRAEKRAARSGRVVPVERILDSHRKFAESFPKYLAQLERVVLYDNNGKEPRLILRKDENGLEIIDQKAYDYFVSGGKNERETQQQTNPETPAQERVEPAGQVPGLREMAGGPGGERVGGSLQEGADAGNLAGIEPNAEQLPEGGNGNSGARGTLSADTGPSGSNRETGPDDRDANSSVQPGVSPPDAGAPATERGSAGDTGRADADVNGVRPESESNPVDAGAAGTGGVSTGSVGGKPTQIASVGNLPGVAGRKNLRLTENPAPTGAVARVKANIQAIRVIRDLEKANRQPTDDEITKLAAWSGWGSFKELFNDNKAQRRDWDEGWNKRYGKAYDQLRDLLTDEEFNAAAESSVNAHFTDLAIVRFGWQVARRLGYRGGRALEPSTGSGVYIGAGPEDLMAATQWTGVELDQITGKIFSYLYPEVDTRIQGFEDAKLPNGHYDIAISNVPFFNVGPGKEYPDLNLHNYFIARMLDKVKPGGLVIAITTKNTMEAQKEQREFLAGKGQLVGAVRLPNNAFKESAGTSVVTDMLVFRKPDGKPFDAQPWGIQVQIGEENGQPILVNEYFANHPEMVLGKHAMAGSMYRENEYTVIGTGDLQAKLDAAVERFPENILEQRAEEDTAEQTQLEDYSLVLEGGQVMEARGFQKHLPTWDTTKPKLVERAKQYIALRSVLKNQYRIEDDPQATPEEIEANRKKLRAEYKKLSKLVDGPLSENLGKLRHLRTDPDYYTVLGLEFVETERDPETGKTKQKIIPADVLTQRVRKPAQPPTSAKDAIDALAISMSYKGELDMDYMAQLTGMDPEAIGKELIEGGHAFLDPDTGKITRSDAYLSGDVRDKLAKAMFVAKEDPRIERNVEALKAIIPANHPFQSIKLGIEARWIPVAVLNKFAQDVMGISGDVISFVPKMDEFAVNGSQRTRRAYAAATSDKTAEYTTEARSALELLENALNMKRAVVKVEVEKGKFRTDDAATLLANNAIDKIKADFKTWTATTEAKAPLRFFDSNRGEYVTEELPIWDVLEREYNRTKNSFVIPIPDGSRMKFPGASDWLWKKKHLVDGVAIMVQQGNKVFAHGVGSGKTPLIIVGDHELKRIGLAKKTVLVVKKPTVGQYRTTIEKIYPGARVLIPQATDFDRANRRRLISRIASGNFDHIILTHEQLKSIRPSEESLRRFFNEQIDQLRDLLRSMGAEDAEAKAEAKGGTRGMDRKVANIVKKLKGLKKKLNQNIEKLAKHHDVGAAWEDLGVDALFIDEAHNFKNMPISTQLDVKGVPVSFSQRAVDLMIKLRDVHRRTNGRNVFFFTGTPVSNTLAELWVMINATNPKVLEQMGVGSFDSFATAYADVVSNFEFGWDNKFKEVTRMSKFKNGASLTLLTRMGMDVQIGNKELGLDVPDMVGGMPQVKLTPVNPQFQRWLDLVEDISAEWDSLEPKDRYFNSWVAIATMRAGSAAALDPRLIFPDAEDHPNSKVNVAIEEMFKHWEEGKERRTTQMVLADLYRPMNTDKLRAFVGGERTTPDTEETDEPGAVELGEAEAEAEDDAQEAGIDVAASKDEAAMEANAAGKFNLYDDIRAKLIKKGVPEHEIAIITEHNTDAKREALFDKVRSGAVRILIGSTEKIGEGVDVPQRMSAMIQLDPPMQLTPAKFTQRLGRIIRQGNLHSPKNWNIPVNVSLYAQERSMDAPIWNMIMTKEKMVTQALKGQYLGDEFEDPANELTVAMGQLVAQATGDTRALDLAKLTEEVRKLALEETAHYRKVNDLQRQADYSARQAGWSRSRAARQAELAAAIRAGIPEDDTIYMIESDKKTKRTGREAVKKSLADLADRFNKVLEAPDKKVFSVVQFGPKLWVKFTGASQLHRIFDEQGKDTGETRVAQVRRMEVAAGSDTWPEINPDGSFARNLTSVTEPLGPRNAVEKIPGLAAIAEQEAAAAKAEAERDSADAEKWLRQKNAAKFDKGPELEAKRAELNKLQGDLMGNATMSDRAALRSARRKGLLMDVPTSDKLPLEIERERVRREIEAAEQEAANSVRAKIDAAKATIVRYQKLAQEYPGQARSFNATIQQEEKSIAEAQDSVEKRAMAATTTQRARLAELEKALLAWLDKMVKATDYDPTKLNEGVTGAPVWMTRAVLNAALRTVRVAVRAGRSLADGINEAIRWMKTEEPNLDEAETRAFLEGYVARNPDRSWQDIEAEMNAAASEFRDVLRLKWVRNRPRGMSPAEAQQAIALAAAKYRTLQQELLESDDYLAHLMKEVSRKIQAGEDESSFLGEVTILEQANPRVVARIRAELIARGELPDTTPAPIEYGRKLDELTQWLQDNTVESPAYTLLDRINVVQDIKDRWHGIQDAFGWATAKLFLARQAFIAQYKAPPVDTPFRTLFKNWKFQDEWTGQEIYAWRKALNEQIRNPLRRQALSVWIDAGGDASLLQFQRDAVPERFQPVWKLATELTESEKAIGRQIIQNLERMKEDGINSGLIERAREDYGMPQVWLKPPTVERDSTFALDEPRGKGGNPTAQLDPRNPFFSFRREVRSYFEGIMAGGIPRSLDAGELVSHYHAAFHKSLNSRAFIASARNGVAADGLPLVKVSGMAAEIPMSSGGRGFVVMSGSRPADSVAADGRPYMPLEHWAMKDWKLVFKDSAGKPIMVRGDMLIHPDHYDFLKNELGDSALREGWTGRLTKPAFALNAYLKASKLAIAGFHMLTIAEHMASHLASPLTNGFRINLKDPTQALLTRHGLELGMAGNHAAFMEGVASHGGLFKQVPGLGTFMANFSDWMFRDYIPTIMMKVGVDSFERNLKRYGGELSRDQIAELTAVQMNAGGGLLNYRQMGRNKTLMDLSRLAALAPMFLEARGRVFAQALKPYHAEQRRLLLVQALGLFVLARVLNQLFDDDPHWEERNWFNVVYKGRAYSLRTIVGDLFHMLHDPYGFASGRLSPLSRGAIHAMTGRDLRSGANINTYFDNKLLRMGEIMVRESLSWLSPVGVEGLLPNATAKETTPANALLMSMGIGSRKETRSSRIYDLAREFNHQAGPQADAWQRARDYEIRGESVYRKLDNLLESGKLEQAWEEFDSLVRTGHPAQNIRNRFASMKNRPFTGTLEREKAFLETLSERDRQYYLEALQERQARIDQFARMLQSPSPFNRGGQ